MKQTYFGSILFNSTYMRVNNFGLFFGFKNIIRLIRGSTYTRVYTVGGLETNRDKHELKL
jgi:hypothetical protein